MDARDEGPLVDRCAAGEEAAWGEFVEAVGPLLAALARRMLGRARGAGSARAGVCEADVDEVVAAVFLALLRRDRLLLRRYDPRWRLSTWLGVICRTEVHRLLRRRAPPATGSGARAVVDPAPGPLERLEAAERREAGARLVEAIAGLGERDRLLLTLRYVDGLRYAAIARALGVSEGSVGPLLARAKERLRRRLPTLGGAGAGGGGGWTEDKPGRA